MCSSIMEELTQQIHYYLKQWISVIDVGSFEHYSDLIDRNFDDLPPKYKELIQYYIEEMLETLDPLISNAFEDAEKYHFLPLGIRELLDSNGTIVFTIGKRLAEAVVCRDLFIEIRKQVQEPSSYKCKDCSLYDLLLRSSKIISVEYG